MARFGSKQPYEEYYVTFDFSNVLPEGASVATSGIVVVVEDSSGATCTSSITTVANQTSDDTSVGVWVKGGVSDNEYKISCKIQTTSTPPEKYELDAVLPVAEL